jgi:iron(III) transport system substrate-binding protein
MRQKSRFATILQICFVLYTMTVPLCLACAEELIVYTALEDDEYPGYLELFKKDHPDIAVKIVRDSTGIVTAKLLAEKANPQADVVWGLAATSLLVCDQAECWNPMHPRSLVKSTQCFETLPILHAGWGSKPGRPGSA